MSAVAQIFSERTGWTLAMRSFAVWLALMAAESVNGAFREAFLVRSMGQVQARQLSFGLSLVILLSLAILFIKWIDTSLRHRLLAIGAFWAILTVCFEVVLGRLILGASWSAILSDYDVTRGGLMAFGIVFMIFLPLLARRLRCGQV
ncbi:MAG: hypothetical protein K1X36_13520 [Pyrinomonadaceae bacterium]|nr:hypothetical protein [Pyrinomonadaceae bacterium]